jgi:hypothetical protein
MERPKTFADLKEQLLGHEALRHVHDDDDDDDDIRIWHHGVLNL